MGEEERERGGWVREEEAELDYYATMGSDRWLRVCVSVCRVSCHGAKSKLGLESRTMGLQRYARDRLADMADGGRSERARAYRSSLAICPFFDDDSDTDLDALPLSQSSHHHSFLHLNLVIS